MFPGRRGTVLVAEPENVQVAAGGSAEFTCSVLTDPALTSSLTTTWLRNEKPIGKLKGQSNEIFGLQFFS